MPRITRRALGRASAWTGLALLAATAAWAVPVTFHYVPPSPQQHVHLAGTFNSWSPTALEMQVSDEGVYTAEIDLAPGSYQYKFVLDGNVWREDPFAPDGWVDDGYGGKNGVVVIPSGVETFTVGKAEARGAPPPATKEPAAAGDAVTGLRKVTFRYQPPIGGVNQVVLAGTFNDWNVGATPMHDDDKDGTWEVTILLAPGSHQYKFVADGQWITDMSADGFTPDGCGGQNSDNHVAARCASLDVARGDGRFYLDDIRYELDYSTVNPVSPKRLVFTARAHLDDVETIFVVYQEADGPVRSVELQPVGEDPALEYRRAAVELEAAAGPVRFAFKYVDGGSEMYVTPHGATPEIPPADARFVYTPEELPVFEIPDWVRDGVIYQIFCDRLFNGDPGNDPDFSEPMYEGRTTLPASGKTNGEYFHLVKDWSDIAGLVRSPYRTDGRPDYYSFYGGDIEGVRQKLPYLQDLGVTILYFNPLNVARSNHKYDPCDYLKVDPHFADDETFKRFVEEAHARGIRIIVDMAFNHCGDCHFAFQDTWKKGRE
ncbi:MAG: alpha-amylase family glycosyl hydrolase, partial [Candidatus Krumholzibacteriia bacterium]